MVLFGSTLCAKQIEINFQWEQDLGKCNVKNLVMYSNNGSKALASYTLRNETLIATYRIARECPEIRMP